MKLITKPFSSDYLVLDHKDIKELLRGEILEADALRVYLKNPARPCIHAGSCIHYKAGDE